MSSTTPAMIQGLYKGEARPPSTCMRRSPKPTLAPPFSALLFQICTSHSAFRSMRGQTLGAALRLSTCGAYSRRWYPQSRLQEATVDFNPDDAQQYLDGVEYPADRKSTRLNSSHA